MIRAIKSKDEFEKLILLRNSIIIENAILPSNVFKPEFNIFKYADEARIMNPEFINVILDLSRHLGIKEIMYMTIDPDPEDFYSVFGMYGAYIFDIFSTANDISQFNGNHHTYSTDKSVLIPICEGIPSWCVYRDRTDCELGIIAFNNNDILDIFMSIVQENIVTDAHEALETLIALGFRFKIPEGFKEEFLKNYDK